MKKLFFIFLFSVAAIGSVKAQRGYKHIALNAGYVYDQAYQFTLAFDFSKKYYNAHSLALKYYRQNEYENMLAGYNYKPVLLREKNTTVRWIFGVYAGTDLNKFVVSPNAGFEILQSLSPGLDLVFSNDNGYYFFSDKSSRWRMSANLGVRFPL